MPDDRPYQGRPSSDRPQFAGPRQNFSGPRPAFQPDNRPPFRPAPRVEVPAAPMIHSLKLRDGDREIEVSGSAAFVRQVLDDLPAMWARLHGEGSSRPGRIDLPSPRPHEQSVTHEAAATQAVAEEPIIAPVRDPATNGKHALTAAATNGKRQAERGTPDDKVLAVLKSSTRPLAVAAIRKRLGGSFTPQQVRRILERNAPKVSVTDDRPATYRLR
ncbi:MAG TPA: hypothetical protein VMU65_05860 [Candidatus Saccharimonadales bacterium]|nr:hypothetical protein [Candidatus Saccharimonadales bacterium]